MCGVDDVIDKYWDSRKQGDRKEVAAKMGVHYGTFCRKTNPNDANDITFNIRELIPYTLNTDFHLLDYIEAQCGRVAFKNPKTGSEVSTQEVANLIETMTSSIAEMAKIISDGIIDPDEKKRLNTLSIKLTQESAALNAAVDNK